MLPPPPGHLHALPAAPLAGTVEQVEEVTEGLQRLDYYLTNVTNEQRYLYARTVRHLRTAESTYTRTLAYMLLICATIVAASVVQVGRGGCEGVGVWGLGVPVVASLAVGVGCSGQSLLQDHASRHLRMLSLVFWVHHAPQSASVAFRSVCWPAAVPQVLGVRMMFKSNRKHGLII